MLQPRVDHGSVRNIRRSRRGIGLQPGILAAMAGGQEYDRPLGFRETGGKLLVTQEALLLDAVVESVGDQV